MSVRKRIINTALIGAMCVAGVTLVEPTARTADYRSFDPSPAWPLCGRITENPPPGWTPEDGCPATRWGNPDHADYPIHSTFGPRLLSSEGGRYDFHRGLDLKTPTGTPVFAAARGQVQIAGNHSSYSEPVIILRHFRPDSWGDCNPDGCYHTLYQHLSGWVVSETEVVEKGQLIGYSGASSSGFQHLHFEIREARAGDASSSWQRDAIHPLRIMPYHADPGATSMTITSVDTSDPMSPVVEVEFFQAAAGKLLDLNRVEVEIYDNSSRTSVPQAGVIADQNGFRVQPPFWDMEELNLMYTHKNSSAFPYSSFDNCPFVSHHGSSYSAHDHLCRKDPASDRIGMFNGMRIEPQSYGPPTEDYRLTIQFTQLAGVLDAGDLCVVVNARNARGASYRPAMWNCQF